MLKIANDRFKTDKNDLCACSSGEKYKDCHRDSDKAIIEKK